MTTQIDLWGEKFISLGDAAKRVPGRPHVSSLARWTTSGLRGVRLESWRIGGRRFTSIEALERFIARTNTPAGGQGRVSTKSDAAKQSDVEKELKSHGI